MYQIHVILTIIIVLIFCYIYKKKKQGYKAVIITVILITIQLTVASYTATTEYEPPKLLEKPVELFALDQKSSVEKYVSVINKTKYAYRYQAKSSFIGNETYSLRYIITNSDKIVKIMESDNYIKPELFIYILKGKGDFWRLGPVDRIVYVFKLPKNSVKYE